MTLDFTKAPAEAERVYREVMANPPARRLPTTSDPAYREYLAYGARVKINNPDAACLGLNVFDVAAAYTLRGRVTTTDPLNEPTAYRGDIELISRAIDRDRFGNAIVNSAGAPFDPPASETHSIFVLYCQRNVPSFDISQGVMYSGAVNSVRFVLPGVGTVDPGQCLCRVYRPVSEWHAGDDFVRVEGIFAFDTGYNPHDFKPIDQGRTGYYSNGGTPTRGTFVGSDGQEPGFDVRLNGSGKPIETFKVRKGPNLNDPTADPISATRPPGITLDNTLTTTALTVLVWETKKRADMRGMPF